VLVCKPSAPWTAVAAALVVFLAGSIEMGGAAHPIPRISCLT
jgi:hypothetical protein